MRMGIIVVLFQLRFLRKQFVVVFDLGHLSTILGTENRQRDALVLTF